MFEVNSMIYAILEQVYNDYAIYYFGLNINNITGKVKFYKNIEPQIINMPENHNVSYSLIVKLFVKYKDEFLKENFPSKISLEI